MRRRTSSPKPSVRVAAIISGADLAEAVTNTVKTAKIGRRFCRCDDVVRNDGIFRMRQGNFNDFCAQLLIFFRRQFDLFSDFGIGPLAKKLLREADDHVLYVLFQGFREVGHRDICTSRIMGVYAADCVEDNRRIGHILRDGPNLVKGRSKGNAAITGDTAIGRFDSDTAIKGSRLTDGSARITAQGPNSFAGCDSSGTAASFHRKNRPVHVPDSMGFW